ncbi:hypothetical protein [Paremcibacter congregatus]|uniref:hypothetical protein n=1 Tax=Paremcibacter congregatus TaxID=2043170 RepID=UPI003A9560FE
MEKLVKASWGLLALIHLMPALVLFKPSLVETLYGVTPEDDVGILLIHRGALFLAVLVAALFAIVDNNARRACSVVVAISIVGFLYVYILQGMPAGDLRKIAIADLIALIPLAFVSYRAWRGKTLKD